jgi:hypothetical protein
MIGSAITILASNVFDGKEEEFLTVVEQLDDLTKRRAYGTVQNLRDLKIAGYYYHIYTWSSPDAIKRFNADTDVQSLLLQLNRTRKLGPLVPLARLVKLPPVSCSPLRESSAAA